MSDSALKLWYEFSKNRALIPTQGLGPTLDITRTTEARFNDISGVIQTAASGEARFDYHPTTHASLGLLVEEARTNIALRSGDISNAVWVVSNISKGSDSVADPTGTANTTVRLTATASNGTCLQTVTSASDDYVYSVYMKRVTGTGNIDLTLDNGVTWTTKTLTSSWTRFDITDPSQTNPVFGVRIVTDTDAIDFWGSEVNKNASFPTSYIPTVASSVTRNDDVVKTTDVSWVNESEGVLYVNWASIGSASNSGSVIDLTESASQTERHTIRDNSLFDDRMDYLVIDGNVLQANLQNTSILTDGTFVKCAISYKVNDFESFVDGNRSGTGDQAGSLPSGFAQLNVGSAGNNSVTAARHIAEIRYYNVRKNNQFLEDLSNGLINESVRRLGGRFFLEADPEIREEKKQELAELIKPKLEPAQVAKSSASASQGPPGVLLTDVKGAIARMTRPQQSRFDRLQQETGISLRELKKILEFIS